jgi:hypothetical protein
MWRDEGEEKDETGVSNESAWVNSTRLEGHDQQIVAERRRKLATARQARETAHRQPRQSQLQHPVPVR